MVYRQISCKILQSSKHWRPRPDNRPAICSKKIVGVGSPTGKMRQPAPAPSYNHGAAVQVQLSNWPANLKGDLLQRSNRISNPRWEACAYCDAMARTCTFCGAHWGLTRCWARLVSTGTPIKPTPRMPAMSAAMLSVLAIKRSNTTLRSTTDGNAALILAAIPLPVTRPMSAHISWPSAGKPMA